MLTLSRGKATRSTPSTSKNRSVDARRLRTPLPHSIRHTASTTRPTPNLLAHGSGPSSRTHPGVQENRFWINENGKRSASRAMKDVGDVKAPSPKRSRSYAASFLPILNVPNARLFALHAPQSSPRHSQRTYRHTARLPPPNPRHSSLIYVSSTSPSPYNSPSPAQSHLTSSHSRTRIPLSLSPSSSSQESLSQERAGTDHDLNASPVSSQLSAPSSVSEVGAPSHHRPRNSYLSDLTPPSSLEDDIRAKPGPKDDVHLLCDVIPFQGIPELPKSMPLTRTDSPRTTIRLHPSQAQKHHDPLKDGMSLTLHISYRLGTINR